MNVAVGMRLQENCLVFVKPLDLLETSIKLKRAVCAVKDLDTGRPCHARVVTKTCLYFFKPTLELAFFSFLSSRLAKGNVVTDMYLRLRSEIYLWN
jgi:hypothetical protein